MIMSERKRRPRRRKKTNLRALIRKEIYGNMETKHFSTTYNESPVSDTSGGVTRFFHVTGISQGDTNGTRDGNQVRLTTIYGKFTLIGKDTTNELRCVIGRYKKGGYTATPFGGTLETNTPIDLDDIEVLSDRLYTVGTAGANIRTFTVFKKFGRRPRLIQFDSTGATDVNTMYFVYFVSDSVAADHPLINGYVRVFFKDV